jgi:hypothetical protein
MLVAIWGRAKPPHHDHGLRGDIIMFETQKSDNTNLKFVSLRNGVR